MDDDQQAEYNRMLWHCRRGMLELDLVLRRFVDRHFAELTQEEKRDFYMLLELEDNELWGLVTGKRDDDEPQRQRLVVMLRAS
jgi:antitoxin CptB